MVKGRCTQESDRCSRKDRECCYLNHRCTVHLKTDPLKRSTLIIVLLLMTIMACLVYRCVGRPDSQYLKPAGNTDSTSLPAPVITEYGLPVDSFIIVSGINGKAIFGNY